MAVIFTESFGWSNVQTDYTALKGYWEAGAMATITTGAWTGSKAGTVPSGGSTGLGINLPYAMSDIIIGFRYQGSNGQARNWDVHTFSAASGGGTQAALAAQNAAGDIRLYENNYGTQDGAVAYSEDGSWHYIEVRLTIGGTSTVKKDGTTVLTAANTRTGSFLSIMIDSAGASGQYLISDVVIIDPSVSPNNSFLGDVHVECRRPNGAGASTQWTASSGANYTDVDDATAPDRDTSYVHTNILGNRDYYGQPAIAEASPAAVYAMGVWVIAKTASAGSGGVKPSISSSGSQLDGSLATPSSSVYQGFSLYADTDPHTSSAWTVSGVNAAQPGVVLV